VTITDEDTHLSDELRAIEDDCPGWHLYTSDAGRIVAVTTRNVSGGFGTTLDAPTPTAMRREIAIKERHWEPAKCWTDVLTAEERQELADSLAGWRDRFYGAGADPARVGLRARDGLDYLGLGHALMNCFSEMRDLCIDVEQAQGRAA